MPTLSEEETNTHLSSAIQASGPSPLSGKGGHLGELLTMSVVFGVQGLGCLWCLAFSFGSEPV
jgi:hypothetical protein